MRSAKSRAPREATVQLCPWETSVETQLRDVAILAMIGLLFVLTLQVLSMTGARRDDDRDGG